ncbi:MAG TPA: hypothetical protein VK922_05230 [Gemmatimonadaceae bacterium]|nr:hypothetical protein [Gemmatimonadaceae bacterium]
MVEYGMVVALIALFVMGAIYLIGGTMAMRVTQVVSCLGTRIC